MRLSPRRVVVAVLALPVCLAASACDLVVASYGGAKIEMTLSGVRATPVFGDPADPRRIPQHVELWARDGDAGIVRLNPGDRAAYAIVPAVSFDDPCMIDSEGNLLWKPEAQKDCFGHPCADRAEQERAAQSVVRRINQLTIEQGVFLFLVAWDEAAAGPLRPTGLSETTMPAERLAACRRYWDASPLAYSGNPLQLTAPVHGIQYGAVDFFSNTRLAQIAGGIQILTDYGLRDVRELFLTQTPAKISEVSADVLDCGGSVPRCRGEVIVQGNAGVLGRGTVHFELASPTGAGTGAATVYINLDDDPVQF